jgi:hypothetical protein
MPNVPEPLLRHLFVKGSLKSRTDGFEFQLNSTLRHVTISALSIAADGVPVPAVHLLLQFPGEKEIPAAFVSENRPVELNLDTPLTLRVISTCHQPRQLEIEAQTDEMGWVRFSVKPGTQKIFPRFNKQK